MDFTVMKAYLPRYWEALLLTLRIGWQGAALALVLGIACAVAVHWKLLERDALDQLHDDIIQVIRVRHVVDADNIRV